MEFPWQQCNIRCPVCTRIRSYLSSLTLWHLNNLCHWQIDCDTVAFVPGSKIYRLSDAQFLWQQTINNADSIFWAVSQSWSSQLIKIRPYFVDFHHSSSFVYNERLQWKFYLESQDLCCYFALMQIIEMQLIKESTSKPEPPYFCWKMVDRPNQWATVPK